MFTKTTLLSIAFAATLSVHAQQATLSWKPQVSIDSKYSTLLRGIDNEIIELKLTPELGEVFGKGPSILPNVTRYDEHLKKLNEQSIYSSNGGVKVDRTLSVRGNLYFFTNIYDKKSKHTSFYCQPLNISNFKNKGENISLGTVSAIKELEQANVKYQLSEDSTIIMMMISPPYLKSADEKYHLGVYNENMVKLWEKTVELPYKDKEITIFDQTVTNDGKVAILIKHFNNGTDKEQITKNGQKTPSYTIKLLLYSKDLTNPQEFLLNTNDKFVHSLTIAKETNNELILFGLHKQKSDGNIKGYFVSRINTKTKAALSNNMSDFPDHLLEILESDEQGSKSKRDGGLSAFFKFIKMETRKNGDCDFLLEFVKGYNTTYGGDINHFSGLHGNIININIKADGKTIITRIPKLQNVTWGPNVSSFCTLPYEDKLLVFYNDHSNNLKQDINKKTDKVTFGFFTNYSKINLVMAVIDAQGNLTRNVILNKQQDESLVTVSNSIKINDNKLALYALSNGKDKIGFLEVK